LNKKHLVASAFAISFLASPLTASAAVITHYDIDFGSPTHTVGSGPSLGTNPNQVSSVVFGSPVIQPIFGTSFNQSLLFDGADTNEQIRLDMAKGFDNYRMEFDLYTSGLLGSDYAFVMLADTPNVRNLNFHGSVGIQYFGSTDGTQNIGSLADNTAYNVVLDYDLSAQLVSWSINGSLTGSNLFTTTGGDINSFRFALAPAIAGAGADPSVMVHLDNIRVTSNAVPEPGSLGLLLLGIGGLLARRRLSGSSD
jgi:hypothetical protein